MVARRWTNDEQQTFLQNAVPGFLQAQRADRVGNFLRDVGNDFFKKWPIASAGEITVKRNQIRSWLYREARPANRKCGLANLGLLLKLLKISQGRGLQEQEVYQKLFNEKIKPVYAKRVEALGAKTNQERMSIRREVVQELWKNEDEDVVAKIKDECKKLNEEKQKAKESIKTKTNAEDSDHRTPEDYHHAISAFPSMIQAVMEALADATGWVVFVSAGGPSPGDNGNIHMEHHYFGPRNVDGEEFPDAFSGFEKGYEAPLGQHIYNCFPADVRESRALRKEDIHYLKIDEPPSQNVAVRRSQIKTLTSTAAASPPVIPDIPEAPYTFDTSCAEDDVYGTTGKLSPESEEENERVLVVEGPVNSKTHESGCATSQLTPLGINHESSGDPQLVGHNTGTGEVTPVKNAELFKVKSPSGNANQASTVLDDITIEDPPGAINTPTTPPTTQPTIPREQTSNLHSSPERGQLSTTTTTMTNPFVTPQKRGVVALQASDAASTVDDQLGQDSKDINTALNQNDRSQPSTVTKAVVPIVHTPLKPDTTTTSMDELDMGSPLSEIAELETVTPSPPYIQTTPVTDYVLPGAIVESPLATKSAPKKRNTGRAKAPSTKTATLPKKTATISKKTAMLPKTATGTTLPKTGPIDAVPASNTRGSKRILDEQGAGTGANTRSSKRIQEVKVTKDGAPSAQPLPKGRNLKRGRQAIEDTNPVAEASRRPQRSKKSKLA